MKGLSVLFFLFASLIPSLLVAQHHDHFEGVLTYEIEFKGPDAQFLRANEPNTRMKMSVGEGSYLIELSEGRYPKMFMFVADSNYEYSIDIANRRAFRYSPHSDLNKETAQVEDTLKAKPTGRSGTIEGRLCAEYKLVKEDAVFLYYVSDDYRVDLSAFPKKPRSKAMFLANGLEGRIPLRTIKRARGLTVTTTLKNLTPQDFEKDAFTIPGNFIVKGRDVRY